MDFTELNEKIFSDSEKEIALFMYNVGITEKPVLSSFEDDGGIFERLFTEHLESPEVSALKKISKDVYLRVLGMHSFGAGAFVAAKQKDSGRSPSEFSAEETESSFSASFSICSSPLLRTARLSFPSGRTSVT